MHIATNVNSQENTHRNETQNDRDFGELRSGEYLEGEKKCDKREIEGQQERRKIERGNICTMEAKEVKSGIVFKILI